MHKFNPSQLGYFLNFHLWEDAKKLLDFQINQMDKNPHYHTLSMFYYQKIVSVKNQLDRERYFQQKVANNLFYGLENEFNVYDYVIPKSHLGLRNQKFFTYPMRVLYYSIGLYLLKVSQDFLQGYVNNNKQFQCFYGGNLHFNDDKLVIKHKTTFYKDYYKEFKRQLINQVDDNNQDINNKLVIKLDIQNYFDNICMTKMLDKIDAFVKPNHKKNLNFDASTKEQIVFYFNYITSNQGGIPQADNNIVSGFLGYIYLLFGDLAIDTDICKYRHFIKEHKIIRFVDDTYVIMNFAPNTKKEKKEEIADSLTSRISDILHDELGLRLNTKTRVYWLDDKKHRDELRKNLKKVSPDYYVDDDEDQETPENKIKNIFTVLENLKASSIDVSLFPDGSLEEDTLKEVYDKKVNQLLKKPDNQTRIEQIFRDFNFDLVKVMPREIILIISKNPNILVQFVKFLESKQNITTRDLFLIINFLCHTEFEKNKISLLKQLKNNASFSQIATVYETGKIASNSPGYYSLSAKKIINRIAKDPHIIEQIRLRVFNEKIGSYSVALNHLLNEIHGICMLIDNNSQNTNKKYEADDVVKYLASKCLPHEICIDIRNLFDRRNHNTVSHPGSEQKIAWAVTKKEYLQYRDAVGKCLEIILNS
ncbi:MAG: AbiA family abortive infection protein [Nostocaceae cyanobacterium]|nr:AbiA family abortive infection protein [Nostocaceae cyanobacterium]